MVVSRPGSWAVGHAALSCCGSGALEQACGVAELFDVL